MAERFDPDDINWQPIDPDMPFSMADPRIPPIIARESRDLAGEEVGGPALPPNVWDAGGWVDIDSPLGMQATNEGLLDRNIRPASVNPLNPENQSFSAGKDHAPVEPDQLFEMLRQANLRDLGSQIDFSPGLPWEVAPGAAPIGAQNTKFGAGFPPFPQAGQHELPTGFSYDPQYDKPAGKYPTDWSYQYGIGPQMVPGAVNEATETGVGLDLQGHTGAIIGMLADRQIGEGLASGDPLQALIGAIGLATGGIIWKDAIEKMAPDMIPGQTNPGAKFPLTNKAEKGKDDEGVVRFPKLPPDEIPTGDPDAEYDQAYHIRDIELLKEMERQRKISPGTGSIEDIEKRLKRRGIIKTDSLEQEPPKPLVQPGPGGIVQGKGFSLPGGIAQSGGFLAPGPTIQGKGFGMPEKGPMVNFSQEQDDEIRKMFTPRELVKKRLEGELGPLGSDIENIPMSEKELEGLQTGLIEGGEINPSVQDTLKRIDLNTSGATTRGEEYELEGDLINEELKLRGLSLTQDSIRTFYGEIIEKIQNYKLAPSIKSKNYYFALLEWQRIIEKHLYDYPSE